MTTDPALATAVDLIKGFEGFSDKPYKDAGGTWTYGFGFTVTSGGKMVTEDTPHITLANAAARLTLMVGRVLSIVRSMVGDRTMTNNQAAALASFAFNEGSNALRKSTLLSLFLAGEHAASAAQFGGWVYCDGKVLPGLVARRADEAKLFLKPDDAPVATEHAINPEMDAA